MRDPRVIERERQRLLARHWLHDKRQSRLARKGKAMPEFILDYGSTEAARAYNALDEFTQGYIEAMFFTDASDPDDGDLEHATVAELAPSALHDIVTDCTAFQNSHREDLNEAIEIGALYADAYDLKAAGRDFWFTRNGHGVGFWD